MKRPIQIVFKIQNTFCDYIHSQSFDEVEKLKIA